VKWKKLKKQELYFKKIFNPLFVQKW